MTAVENIDTGGIDITSLVNKSGLSVIGKL